MTSQERLDAWKRDGGTWSVGQMAELIELLEADLSDVRANRMVWHDSFFKEQELRFAVEKDRDEWKKRALSDEDGNL